jgi:hypothetical protein
VSRVAELARQLTAAKEAEEKTRVSAAAAVSAAESAPTVDLAPLQQKLATAEDTNRRVRAKQARAAKSAEVDSFAAKSKALDQQLEAIDTEKVSAITAAKLPVAGLTIGESAGRWVVLLNGIPFSQCSAAERLRTSVTIGLALNPRLRLMLIRDGSLLDADGMRLLGELAAAADAQVLIERVSGSGETGVLIEDGSVVETAKASTEAA